MLKKQLFFVVILIFLLAPAFAFAGLAPPHMGKHFPSLAKQHERLLQAKKNADPAAKIEAAKGFSQMQRLL